ncbi:hypothetical protein HPB51_020087 [Rhipicephalus microplus]|uniref:Uncharacterized protein n=1 Tax=Rhipicephalus microplus TaxID=6941 RepID=A0A9J6EBM8_RHIMP|nr:hypothetical protein HPB51_020087 [Rhipicephalus microplus]
MPPLPCEETKVVVRPRGGLCISKSGASVVAEAIWSAAGLGPEERNTDTICPNHLQNIMVVSTSSQENVKCYVNVEAITVAGQRHEVGAYVAAPHVTCKGVIHRIPLSDDPGAIDRKIVNARNPLALGAKRIKNTGVIIVLFDGECQHQYRIFYVVRRRRGLRARAFRERSPSVNVDGFLELNDCHQQGQPGPSTPGGRFKSRGRFRTRGSCRSRSTSRLRLGSRSRSGARFMSRTRSQSRGGTRPRPSSSARSGSGLEPGQGKADAPSTRPNPSPRTDCGHARGLQLSRAVHATEDQSRGKSNLTWADRVRSNDGEQPMRCDPSPEHARDAEILRLKKKNAELKDTLTKMANEMAEFERMLSTMHSKTEGETTDTPVPAPISDGPMATKRRAVVSKLKNTESQVEEIKQTLVTITENIKMVAGSVASLTESVGQMQAALSDPVEGLRVMNERIIALEIHAKLPKSAPQGASPGNVEMAIPVQVDSRRAYYEDEQIFRTTLTPQGGDQSRIHYG